MLFVPVQSSGLRSSGITQLAETSELETSAMAYLLEQLQRFYHYVNNEISDPRMSDYPMISSPWPVLAVVGFYVYFSKSLGPRLMLNRKPFQILPLIQVYNVVQIALNLWMLKRAAEGGFFTLCSWKCQPVDYSTSPFALKITRGVYDYFLLKLLDLLDTLFFVLRKKNSHISFLHLFHHTAMVIVTYIGTKYVAGGHSVFLGVVNCAVHSVMYSYYLLTSLYPQSKQHRWWKKYITQMQMVQFLVIGGHQAQLLFRECDYPAFMNVLGIPLTIIITWQFYIFYKREYGVKNTKKMLKNQ